MTEQAIQPAPIQDDIIDIEYLMKIKFRVGKIEAAEPIPKSRKLLKLQVDLGPQYGKRQILAGIQAFYDPATLIGRQIVVVANLKPATLAGEQSQGMLLAASNEDNTILGLLAPDKELPAGAVVR